MTVFFIQATGSIIILLHTECVTKKNRKKKNASKAPRLIDADVLLCGQAAEPVSTDTDQVVQHRI